MSALIRTECPKSQEYAGGVKYFLRAYATNNNGTGYGMTLSFTTLGSVPKSISRPATRETPTSATLNGIVNPNYISTIVTFEYGTTTNYGQSAALIQNPLIGNSDTLVYANINGLTPETTYHYRIKSVNSLGTSYSNDMSFKTISTVKDFEGNVYQTVKIGTQIWMSENLKSTKFNDGTSITLIENRSAWYPISDKGYCWYNNDPSTYRITGALYNGLIASDNKVCPTGWHIPTYADWDILANYLGGFNIAGGKLKESGSSHWPNPNTGASNESGFTAIPAGCRLYNGAFGNLNYVGYWCYSGLWEVSLNSGDNILHDYINQPKSLGLSIRCIKD